MTPGFLNAAKWFRVDPDVDIPAGTWLISIALTTKDHRDHEVRLSDPSFLWKPLTAEERRSEADQRYDEGLPDLIYYTPDKITRAEEWPDISGWHDVPKGRDIPEGIWIAEIQPTSNGEQRIVISKSSGLGVTPRESLEERGYRFRTCEPLPDPLMDDSDKRTRIVCSGKGNYSRAYWCKIGKAWTILSPSEESKDTNPKHHLHPGDARVQQNTTLEEFCRHYKCKVTAIIDD